MKTEPIYLTVLLYAREGQEGILDQYENLVLPLLSAHGGKLHFRIRPGSKPVTIRRTNKLATEF